MYSVFVRSWWRDNPDWPNGLEPHAGKKKYIERFLESEEEAQEICQAYNQMHDAGRYSIKAEYEEM